MIVAELERALLERYPKADAEGWDHVGLSVGDPAAEITGVACALDATEANVRRAQEAGANVLLTHHPVYIKAPEAFCPSDSARPQCSAALFEAARCGVSIISLHTNLDRSHEARTCLSELLGAAPVSSLEHVDDPEATGLGALATLNAPCTLRDLATRAATAFGSDPRVWGDADHPCRTVAILGGSLGDFGELAIAAGADVGKDAVHDILHILFSTDVPVQNLFRSQFVKLVQLDHFAASCKVSRSCSSIRSTSRCLNW